MPQGFLAVWTHPSPQLPLKEFHEWYDEEHIPIRLNRFEEFLSGARYQLVSHDQGGKTCGSIQTAWLALYTVESPAIFSSSTYQDLRINRSDREKSVMSRIEVLIRKTGEIVCMCSSGEQKGKLEGPSGWVVIHGISTGGVDGSLDDVHTWARYIEQEVDKHNDIKEGWGRTLIVLVLESGVSQFGMAVEAEDGVNMPYFAVHGELFENFHSDRR
jgi:hypothetical protein